MARKSYFKVEVTDIKKKVNDWGNGNMGLLVELDGKKIDEKIKKFPTKMKAKIGVSGGKITDIVFE